ncbi:hypothetical protein [Kineosporia succinea]|uniref:DUF2188 domain-containing protein n=1 Tax=Kineosporia succinea TaxID=84632 RepID=A0ABT9P5X3_9ACTN|nr:hypothetical protein [Kineosporia succinea]MDP9828094.1 hypothetical protein [Kineosporia succinea]
MPPRELITTLHHWEGAGGTWQVVGRTAQSVTVALCRCDGGEEVERVTSHDALDMATLAGRNGSSDDV